MNYKTIDGDIVRISYVIAVYKISNNRLEHSHPYSWVVELSTGTKRYWDVEDNEPIPVDVKAIQSVMLSENGDQR